ncbi:MAG: tRNA pseudouridine(55) synthase TruB [bacterium]
MFQSNKPCFIVLNKNFGISSATALNKLKGLLKIKKAGFCGTLDPLASGVIVVATGKATKLLPLITELDKTYSGKMLLGFTSASYDKGTELAATKIPFEMSKIDLKAIENKFTGKIEQIPPSYSAVKIDGVRAYKLAREGKSPEIKKREVFIDKITLSAFSNNEVSFKVKCSKGTYVRSLVNDIGEHIGCGAVLSELTREKVGDFKIENSATLQDIEAGNLSMNQGLVEIDAFLSRYNTLEVERKTYDWLSDGKEIKKLELKLPEGLNYIRFDNKPAFILKSENNIFSYYISLRDLNE